MIAYFLSIKKFIVGIFMVLSVLVLSFGFFWTLDYLLNPPVKVIAEFSELGPFYKTMPVYYKGYKIGKTGKVRPSKDFKTTLVSIIFYPEELKLPANVSAKVKQLSNGIDYISPLPAKLVSAEQCVVIPCINNKNKTAAVTIASASIGETEELEVIVRNPAGSRISVMSSKCREIEPISISQEPDGLKVVLPELMPYEIITIFAEQE